MAFQHEPDNRLVAICNLLTHIACHSGLQCRILLGVGVTAVDHDIGGETHGLKICFALRNMFGEINGATTAPSEHNVTVSIAAGFKNRDITFRVDAQKTTRIGY